MTSISQMAEQLAETLPVVLADRDLDPADLDRLASLPEGFTNRLLDCDPAVFPCPRQWHRMLMVLQVTAQELLAE